MATHKEAEALTREGRFRDAAQCLSKAKPSLKRDERLAAEVLEAHLLERTGNHLESRTICQRVLKNPALSSPEKSVCEATLGIIKSEGDPDSSVVHFQKAVALAQAGKDLTQTCWSQLRLILALADRNGPSGIGPLLSAVRENVVKLGDPRVSAALHIFVGEMEAKRGLIRNAARHAKLGKRLLGDCPNVWLDALAENILTALAIMDCDYATGLEHAQKGLELAGLSGSASLRRACLGNLGNLHYLMGGFSDAIQCYQSADAELCVVGGISSAALESLAKLRIREGDLSEADRCLKQLDELLPSPSARVQHANRHAEVTRIELLERQGALGEAVRRSSDSLELATRAGDHLLVAALQLLRADLFRKSGRHSECFLILEDINKGLPHLPRDIHAQYERILACALAADGHESAGRLHLERSKRIYQGLKNVPGLLDLNRGWSEATRRPLLPIPAAPLASPIVIDEEPRSPGNLLQNIATLLMHAGRPELIATGLVAILADSASVISATATARAADGSLETLASFRANGSPGAPPRSSPPIRILAIGSARNRTIEVTLQPRDGIESIATLNAASLLLATLGDLERAHAEREERQTLWPVEEIPIDGEQAVVAGKMRELMAFARRIATTTISVLITGESGTGKEILASAIHRASTRANKPFVPFNCTAIPREMLESQLFGHRRGAFTGAERDNAGLIRTAKDGTLFLDEIGELGLDLQPKLLRFLESGEINPLGESSPLNIDVRIIAATNSNLEQLVEEGRFREDLFYRLNVIRLAIPPLRERRDEIPALVHHFVAKAAAEFSKGRVRVAEETMEHLLLYPWPGNVRQLFNELRRMVALADADAVLSPSALALQILRATPKAASRSNGPELAVPLHNKLIPTLSRIEREMIRVALNSHQGQLEAAARALGISRKGLYLKRQRLGL